MTRPSVSVLRAKLNTKVFRCVYFALSSFTPFASYLCCTLTLTVHFSFSLYLSFTQTKEKRAPFRSLSHTMSSRPALHLLSLDELQAACDCENLSSLGQSCILLRRLRTHYGRQRAAEEEEEEEGESARKTKGKSRSRRPRPTTQSPKRVPIG